jgi:hypothetical protein
MSLAVVASYTARDAARSPIGRHCMMLISRCDKSAFGRCCRATCARAGSQLVLSGMLNRTLGPCLDSDRFVRERGQQVGAHGGKASMAGRQRSS